MSDPWSERAELYRTSAAHSSGPDLDLIVEWAAGCATAIDVATGGGHVARRLREAGLEVVSCDPAPGMQPDVVCFAEELPFADGSFDLAVTRVAAHHFADVAAGDPRARTRRLEAGDRRGQPERRRRRRACREAARSLARPQLHRGRMACVLRRMPASRSRRFAVIDFPVELEPWLERTGCAGDEADEVRALLAARTHDGFVHFARIALLGSVD